MDCLSPQDVSRFVAGELSPEARAAADAHLATCDACVARIETERLGREATAPHATFPVLEVMRRPPGDAVEGVEDTAPGRTDPGLPGHLGRLRPAAMLRPGEVPRGTSVGRYLIIERIGEGAMGSVYLAYDPDLDRRVAVKLLRPEHREEQAELYRARLIREAQAMARLAHPNVVSVYDAGSFGSRVFVAMEYVDGPNLAAWMKVTPHDWKRVLRVFREAGSGLAAAHAAGLVHRDFKPENVVLTSDAIPR